MVEWAVDRNVNVFRPLPAILLIGLACVAAVASLPSLGYVPGCIRSDVWPASLIALHVISDGLIALAYVWIPITLIAVWRRRDDIPFNWTLLCFAGFIVSCGVTHVMGIVTTWRPSTWRCRPRGASRRGSRRRWQTAARGAEQVRPAARHPARAR